MCSFPCKISLCSVPAPSLSPSLQQLYLFWCLSFGSSKCSVSSSAARWTAAETAAFLLVEKWVVFAFTISAQHAWHTYNTKKCACVEQEKLNLHRFLTSVLVWEINHEQKGGHLTEQDKKNSIFHHTVWVCTSLEEGERSRLQMKWLPPLFTSCPCLWVTDPCRREQHRNREHYSEIKVDLELLPHHLAQAAGKSKQCRKWMNTQRG